MGFKTMPSTEAALRHRRAGAMLFELLVAIGVGTLVVLALVGLTIYSARSFATLANYVEMNAAGARAMDALTRDIRQTVELTSYSTNQLVFDNGTNGPKLTFTYDPINRALIREQGGITNTLLTGCDSLQFSIYQRTPMAGTYDQYPAAEATNCKVVSIKWTCSRTLLGLKSTTETDEEAKVVIRKH